MKTDVPYVTDDDIIPSLRLLFVYVQYTCDYVLRERKGRGKDNLHTRGRVKSSIIAISDFGQRGESKGHMPNIRSAISHPFFHVMLFSFSSLGLLVLSK